MSVEFEEWFSSQQNIDLKEELLNTEQTQFEDVFSREVWKTTYKDYKDETIDDTIYRVAATAASVELTEELQTEWTRKFYYMLSQFRGTAGGRIYSNIGTEWKGTTLMNCFVAPRPDNDIDSLNGILTNLTNQAQTLKAEGGWGENFSYIRPRGSFIYGIGVETPGAVKYMEMFDKTSEIITSGSGKKSENKKAKGKIRKGAMMGVLDVSHPDIIEFITAKQSPGRLTKFNLSVNCTNEFMDKVLLVQELNEDLEKANQELKDAQQWCVENEPQQGHGPDFLAFECRIIDAQKKVAEADKWELRFPDTQSPMYKDKWCGHLGNWEAEGRPTKIYQTVSVTWLWGLMMESTYNRAEPGVLFLDRANHFSPLNYKETIQATNPCGEQTLAP
ncbi:hypothetical protein LCGC14_1599900, partial [marine sediment metagenome]